MQASETSTEAAALPTPDELDGPQRVPNNNSESTDCKGENDCVVSSRPPSIVEDGRSPLRDTKSDSTIIADPRKFTSTGDVHFAFGPNGTYYCTCRGTSRWSGVIGVASAKPNQPYIVALAPDGGWFIACENESFAAAWALSGLTPKGKCPMQGQTKRLWIKTRDAYERLSSWIPKHFDLDSEKLLESALTFGPQGSYYARAPSGVLWNDLPAELEAHISQRKRDCKGTSAPKFVTLGVDRTWFALWDDDTFCWDVGKSYPEVAAHLTQAKPGEIGTLVLSPYKAGQYLLAFSSGLILYAVPGTVAYTDVLMQYMQKRCRETGATFQLVQSLGTVTTATTISPTTQHDTDNGNQLGVTDQELHRQNAELGIKASGASIKASHVAVGAAVLGLVSCTIM